MAQKFQLDKSTILVRLGGDEDLFGAMADMYLQDWGGYCAQIAEALAAGDATVVMRQAHTIKSLLATFADEDGAALASSAEVQARNGDLSGLDGLVSQVQERLRLVAAALESELR